MPSGAEINLFNINESPRLLKIKLDFDSSKGTIGVSGQGYLKDKSKTFALKPLTKYEIKINAGGNYDLFLIKNGRSQAMGSLELPMTLSSFAPNASVFFNNAWYHGQIEFIRSVTGISAINGVDLEHAIWAVLSPFVRINDTTGAIKSAAVIMRSSFFSLTLTSKDEYHFTASNIGYHGLEYERDFVINLIKQTEGEVLMTRGGELLYTPIRISATEGSLPFELIGQRTKAWEKVMPMPEVEQILNMEGFQTGHILSFEQKVLVSPKDVFPVESGPFLSVEGVNNTAQMSAAKAQAIFKLPSPFFRVYSFNAEDGMPNLQFIGNMPNYQNFPSQPALNIVRLIYEKTNPNDDYSLILKEMYPAAYLSRI